MYTNFIRSSVSLMGGIYLGNVVYKKAREENSSSIIHKISKVAVDSIESESLGNVVCKAIVGTVIAHTIFSAVSTLIDSKKVNRNFIRLINLTTTAIGTYDISTIFFMGGGVVMHSRKNLSDDKFLITGLFRYLLTSGFQAFLNPYLIVWKKCQEITQKANEYARIAFESINDIHVACKKNISKYFTIEQSKEVENILTYGRDFVNHLEEWPNIKKKLKRTLEKYECALEKKAQDLGIIRKEVESEIQDLMKRFNDIDKENKFEFFLVFLGSKPLKIYLNEEIEITRNKLEEIDQLICKTKHLVKEIKRIAHTNDIECHSFKIWDDAIKMQNIGWSVESTIAFIWDWLKLLQSGEVKKEGNQKKEELKNKIEDKGAMIKLMREKFNEKNPQIIEIFLNLLKALHQFRRITLDEINMVHFLSDSKCIAFPLINKGSRDYYTALKIWKDFFYEMTTYHISLNPSLIGCESANKESIKKKISIQFLKFFEQKNLQFVTQKIEQFHNLSTQTKIEAIRNKIAVDSQVKKELYQVKDLSITHLDFLFLEEFFEYFQKIESISISNLHPKFLSNFRTLPSLKSCSIDIKELDHIPIFLKGSKNLEHISITSINHFNQISNFPDWFFKFEHLQSLEVKKISGSKIISTSFDLKNKKIIKSTSVLAKNSDTLNINKKSPVGTHEGKHLYL